MKSDNLEDLLLEGRHRRCGQFVIYFDWFLWCIKRMILIFLWNSCLICTFKCNRLWNYSSFPTPNPKYLFYGNQVMPSNPNSNDYYNFGLTYRDLSLLRNLNSSRINTDCEWTDNFQFALVEWVRNWIQATKYHSVSVLNSKFQSSTNFET